MAKNNKQKPVQGSVRGATDDKTAILNALQALQDCHQKDSEIWSLIEKSKAEIQNQTDAEILKAKKDILINEFKKAMNEVISE